eukprot:GHVO01047585.1.p1 GENE.GHVO01047585.1~~GHVO01047585.1.p1  ORF type:complete len:178 (+),score=23.70 GHVO01047585.1:33-536(+)
MDETPQQALKRLTPHEPVVSKRGIIYMGNLPKDFEEKAVRRYLSQFGKVTKLKVARSAKTGHSKGFAFVEFAFEEVAEIVARTIHRHLIGSKTITCHMCDSIDSKVFRSNSLAFSPPQKYNKERKRHNVHGINELPKNAALYHNRLVEASKKQLKEKNIKFTLDHMI